MSQDHRITRLISSVGRTRTFEYDDGSVETRTGGSASWRNNNPGNLKFEFAGSADKTAHSHRTREQAVADARKYYDGVVGLDQWGNAVFESVQAGEAAQLKLLSGRYHSQTVEELVHRYSKSDYSGGTHHAQQIASIHRTAQELGVDLHGKTVDQMSAPERHALARGIQRFEGFRIGESSREPALARPSVAPIGGPASIYAEAELHFFRSGTMFEYGRPDNSKPGRDLSRTEQDLDHDGRRGVDCSAFVWRGLKNAGYGVSGEDARDFSTHTLFSGTDVTAYARRHFEVISASQARAPNGVLSRGDILLFSDGRSQHVGIFKGYDADGRIQFIGSQSSRGPETVTVKPHGYWDGDTTHIVGALRAKPEFQIRHPLHASTTPHEHATVASHPTDRAVGATPTGDITHVPSTHANAAHLGNARPVDPQIARLQSDLNDLGARDARGAPLAEDGIVGRHTREALKGFQHDHGLPETGRVDSASREALTSLHGLRLTDTSHPDYPLFERTLGLVEAAERTRGITPGVHSANIAAALVVSARDAGLQRIDRVDFGEPPRFVRAVQVMPGGAPEHERMATLETRTASVQSLHASSDMLAQLSPRPEIAQPGEHQMHTRGGALTR
ncbi:XVIPCD domain-containing protein [Lysobacter claricitrinus]|uniref:XVIPCD domain-containing protein n=1 Tax=Lysobacter claricitrinus TaxID=3367728 RepID=UPI0037DB1B6D